VFVLAVVVLGGGDVQELVGWRVVVPTIVAVIVVSADARSPLNAD
jgi:hypothetical protein